MIQILDQFSNPDLSRKLLDKVKNLAETFIEKHGRKPVIMEVCGSHTMALARSGIKQALRDYVKLVSGPGCPVCVTDQKSIDAMIQLAQGDGRIICTFGDMIRVPGSNGSLLDAKSEGKDIRVVYSPSDSVRIAEKNPDKEVIFLGIGFETTIPSLGIALKEANEKGLEKYSMWVTTKLVEPILRVLLEAQEVKLDGFLLPGHVSIVLGKHSYHYLVDEYGVPGTICGFEPVGVLGGIYKLIAMLLDERVEIENYHTHVVTHSGNSFAQEIMKTYFKECDEWWRGLGVIPNSGLDIRKEFAHLDAKKKFNVHVGEPRKTKCRCGDILRGLAVPEDCVLYGKACTPSKPIGPCMVSSEGTCAAHYQYMRGDII
ncbi:hydrogenase formation protein HypD [Microaerobacter geothermalis]|uniref:hydrogenase formation protein HypD n=1 Tax=Microaerobacter geothermalis TaxID=674972 RepID=UPI001F342028|nr:hydrogenase formation protein HypD [Microaerobacter geothermalis]MCF6092741.1 hydrogenase formation protein HypD [Microaerobacter geothermalis]